MQKMKFKIESPEQSKALQKVLFEQGWAWGYSYGCDGVMHCEKEVIYTESNGSLSFSDADFYLDYSVASHEHTHTAQYITDHTPPIQVEKVETPPQRNKYSREISPGVWVDVYDVLNAWTVTDPCLQHLIKKALAVGQRGHKDAETDYKDILASSKRALEIHLLWANKSEN